MAYDTQALTNLARKGIKLPVCDVDNLSWIEIDNKKDFIKAKKEIHPLIRKNKGI